MNHLLLAQAMLDHKNSIPEGKVVAVNECTGEITMVTYEEADKLTGQPPGTRAAMIKQWDELIAKPVPVKNA